MGDRILEALSPACPDNWKTGPVANPIGPDIMGSSYKPTGRPNGVRRKRPGVPFHTDEVRAKIQASNLITRLHKHIFENLELSLSQIRAIDILLKKCIPDLTSTTITSDVTVRYVAHLPEPISRKAWLEKYSGDYLDPQPIIEGTVDGGGSDQENGTAKNGKTEGLH